MAINLGPFKNVIAYNTSNGYWVEVIVFDPFGWSAGPDDEVNATMFWGINGVELDSRPVTIGIEGLQVGSDNVIDILPTIQAVMADHDPPIASLGNGHVNIFVGFTPPPPSTGMNMRFRSIRESDDEVIHEIDLAINNQTGDRPAAVKSSDLTWHFPAPPSA